MRSSCSIAYQRDNGEIVCIYCHWDGYLAYVGQTLKLHYKDPETIEKLMALGDLSSLGKYPEVDPNGWEYSKKGNDDLCVNYKSRGDRNCDAEVFPDYNAYIKYATQSYLPFHYIFKDFGSGKRWYYFSSTFPQAGWKVV